MIKFIQNISTILETPHLTLLSAGPLTILEWQQESFEKFMGANINYEVGMSRPDLDSTFYFAVRVNMVYENQFNGKVFQAKTEMAFHIGYRHSTPTVGFLFNLLDQATFAFAKVFHERVQQTNLRYHQVPKPQLEAVRETLQQAIDDWDASAKRFKESGGV
ncbi:MAG: hypothetical protein EOP50_19275, partial [Sphingobacteriales bacterium]